MLVPEGLARTLLTARVRRFLRRGFERIAYKGRGRECPLCAGHFRKFLPLGVKSTVLVEKKVIGGGYRKDARCPGCESSDRERLLYLFLRSETDLFTDRMSVLHVAPEAGLGVLLQRQPGIDYFTGDRSPGWWTLRMDLTALPLADRTFDVVICNHVFEHVRDDVKAMREVHRVMKGGGWAVLQVPIGAALDATLEDPAVSDARERERLFGQHDHVRLYSKADYVRRLESVGFAVSAIPYARMLGDSAIRRFGLLEDEEIFYCRRG